MNLKVKESGLGQFLFRLKKRKLREDVIKVPKKVKTVSHYSVKKQGEKKSVLGSWGKTGQHEFQLQRHAG